MASSVAELSNPCTLGCTTTARSMPMISNHFEIMFERCCRRRVFVGREEGKIFGRSENMEMGVAGIGWRRIARLARVRIGRITIRHRRFLQQIF